jgi:hypothetical protein
MIISQEIYILCLFREFRFFKFFRGLAKKSHKGDPLKIKIKKFFFPQKLLFNKNIVFYIFFRK